MSYTVKCLGYAEEDAGAVLFSLKRKRYFIYNPMDLLGSRAFGFKTESSVRNYFLGLSDRLDSVEQYFYK